ncbi:Nlrc3, partial [Symbiodinium natans]
MLEVQAARAKAPKGIRMQDVDDLVEDNREWLEEDTCRGSGRRNMYDLCQRIIAWTTCQEEILVLSEEDAAKIAMSLSEKDEPGGPLFEDGTLQFRPGVRLANIDVAGFAIEGILCEGGEQRQDYWAEGEGRQRHWKTSAKHGRKTKDAAAIPEFLKGCKLGEASARRKKKLLKKPGTAVVLRKGVAYVDLTEQGEFGPLSSFVSHFWGEETLQFKEALLLHARKIYPADPGKVVYYICTFSNNQHCVDLGTDWRESPFNLALEYVAACHRLHQEPVYGAVMVIDAACTPLKRIWCVFEVFRCHALGLKLDLYSSEGQLCRGSSSKLMDEILKILQKLDLKDTQCSEPEDKLKIEAAITEHPGGWTAVAGMVQLQVMDLLTFTGRLAVTRNAFTGQEVEPEEIELQDLWNNEVKLSGDLIDSCIKGDLSRILLIGPGGSGKTVFAREVVRRVVHLASQDAAGPSILPVRVPLAELAQYVKDPSGDLLRCWAEHAFGAESEELFQGDRQLLLVLDSFDEAGAARRQILSWLEAWLQAHSQRCTCAIMTSRPSGTEQILEEDGSAREAVRLPVLGQLSETCLVTRETPESRHIQLLRSSGSPATNLVVSMEQAFLLPKLDLQPGLHRMKVRRKDPRWVYSTAITLQEWADNLPARALLEQALRKEKGDPERTYKLGIVYASGKHLKDKGIQFLSYHFRQHWYPCHVYLYQAAVGAEEPQDGEPEEVELNLRSTADGTLFLTGNVGVGDLLDISGQEVRLLPPHRVFAVTLDQAVVDGAEPTHMVEFTAQMELATRLRFRPLEMLPLTEPAAARISACPEEELHALPSQVWQTPLMASLLGKYRQERKELSSTTAELEVMQYAVETLLAQAEQRTSSSGLRGLLRPACFRTLKAGQRLLFEEDFAGNKAVFAEALRGHLSFLEPAAGQNAAQIYHLRMHELLGAEAWRESEPSTRHEQGWCRAFQQAQVQPMLRGALRYLLMMETTHARATHASMTQALFSGWELGLPPTISLPAIHQGPCLNTPDAEARPEVSIRLGSRQAYLNGYQPRAPKVLGNLDPSETMRLDLRGLQHLAPLDGEILGQGLGPQCKNLMLLSRTGAEKFPGLAPALRHCGMLRQLSLHWVSYGEMSPEAACILEDALSSLPELRQLKLQDDCHMEVVLGREARPLIQSLRRLHKLTNLELNVWLGPEETAALADSLPCLPELWQLELRLRELGMEAAASLADALSSLQELQQLMLRLGGSNLGTKAAALAGTLSGLQKIPGFQQLQLELFETELGLEGSRSLAEAIGRLPGLTTLELGLEQCQLGADGAIALIEALSGLRELRQLKLVLDGPASPAFARGIGQLPRLRKLELSGFHSGSIGMEAAVSLADALSSQQDLQQLMLHLGGHELGREATAALADALGGLRELQLLNLHLGWNELGPEGGQSLAQALGHLQKLTTLELDVHSCELGPEEGHSLAKALGQLPELTVLSLELMLNPFGPETVAALADSLSGLRELQHLQLEMMHIELGPEAGHALVHALGRLPKLTTLILYNCQFGKHPSDSVGSEAAVALPEAFSSLQELQELTFYMHEVQLSPEGGQSLAQALGHLQKLTKLDLILYACELGPAAGSALANSLGGLKDLVRLDMKLQHNQIGLQPCLMLAENLSRLKGLASLKIDLQNVGVGPGLRSTLPRAVSG